VTVVTINVQGLKEVQAELRKARDFPRDALPQVLTEAGALLLNRIRTRFLQQTDPNGQKWPESQAAKDRAADPTGGGGTLFDTGKLFRSIQLRKGGTREKLKRYIYTDVPYGAYHQFGRGQQQRIFLGFSNGDIKVIERLVQARLLEVLGGRSG
jgi:phage gpG-like protein